MTLKEKFLKSPDEGGSFNLNSHRAKNNVKIADEFAIGFARWLQDNDGSASYEELLEIYKKEKGL